METPSLPLIYIGFRPTYRDPLYGTGAWERDQIKLVPLDVANRMKRHADVWQETKVTKKETAGLEPSETPEGVPVVTVNQPIEEQKQLDEIDGLKAQIHGMNKEAVREFAEKHYATKLDGRLSVADLRTKAIALVEQYGPQ